MLFGLLTLFTALAIAGVAAWFSIVGLMTFFQGAALSIAIMAGTLEVGKLVTVSWLYRYWKETSILVKTYLSIAVIFLMLITSIGIFGYLSKAHQEVSGSSSDAFAIVERLDSQVLREENKIGILEDRIASLQTGGGLDVSSSIQQQILIRDGAWERVQGDIDYAQVQIRSIRDQLVIDLKSQDDKLIPLDSIVNSYADQGTTTTETDAGGLFRSAEIEVVDNVAKANEVRQEQKAERDAIADEKNSLRLLSQTDINSQQTNINRYRAQAQTTIDDANEEINKLRDSSSANQDDAILKIDDYNTEIDTIYDGIVVIKDERFVAQQVVRDLEKEIGPIKYVAELVYGASDEQVLDQAIRLFIILLVVVFDPLAIMLLIAANQTLLRFGINLEDTGPKPHFVDEIINPSEDDIIDTYKQMATSIATPDDKNQKKRITDLEKQLAKKPKTVEVIKEVEVVKEVPVEIEKEIDMDAIKTPKAIKVLEAKLKKKLDDERTRS